jgi:hypothetical protein
MPMTPEQLLNWFSYHAPDADSQVRYVAIRDAAHRFAVVLNDLCPDSADKTTAIRKVREAMMTANASIACGGK